MNYEAITQTGRRAKGRFRLGILDARRTAGLLAQVGRCSMRRDAKGRRAKAEREDEKLESRVVRYAVPSSN